LLAVKKERKRRSVDSESKRAWIERQGQRRINDIQKVVEGCNVPSRVSLETATLDVLKELKP